MVAQIKQQLRYENHLARRRPNRDSPARQAALCDRSTDDVAAVHCNMTWGARTWRWRFAELHAFATRMCVLLVRGGAYRRLLRRLGERREQCLGV